MPPLPATPQECDAHSRRPRLRQLVRVGAIGFLGLAGLSKLGRFSAIAEILSNFQWHLGVLCVGLAVPSAVLRQRVLAVLLLAVGLGLLQPESALRGGADTAPSVGTHLRLLTANALFHNDDREALLEFLRSRDEDVLIVQEVSGWLRPRIDHLARHPHRFLYPQQGYDAGTWSLAVLSRRPLSATRIVRLARLGFPMVEVSVDWDGAPLLLRAVHLPHPSAHGFRLRGEAFQTLAAQGWSDDVVLLGDFNATATSPLLADFLSSSSLRDARRGFGRQATWPSALPSALGIAIDHTLLGGRVRARDRRLVDIPGSDHRGITLTLTR